MRAVVLAVAIVSTAVLASTARGAPRAAHDPADTAASDPLDLRTASLTQSGADLVLRVRVAGRRPLALLGARPGRSLCLLVREASGGSSRQHRACLHGRGVRKGPRVLVASISATGDALHPARAAGARLTTPRADVVRAAIPLASLHLRPGSVRWSVRSAWTGPAPCGGTVAPPACVDVLPDKGSLSVTLRAGRVIGCDARAGGPVRSTGPAGRMFALTFDDGPGPYTPQIESVLERMGAPATFFVVGVHVAGNEASLRRALSDGDALGNHSYNHVDLSAAGASARAQIDSTQATIRRATGYTPCLLRPPYGTTSSALTVLLNGLGLAQILWNDDPADFRMPGVGSIESTVLAEARPGGIAIMHDGGGDRSQTVAALPHIIDGLRARGLTLVTVPRLLGLELRR